MANYEISAGTLFEDFEDSTEWSGDASGSVANDTTFVKSGSKSLKITVTAGQASSAATKTISADFSNAGTITFWIYLESTLSYYLTSMAVIYLSSTTNFSKYFSKGFTAVLHEGWNKLTIGRDQWTNTGTESWANTMVRLRFRLYADSSHEVVGYFDSLYTGVQSRPKCILTFDDGWDSQYTYGYLYMRNYGFKGVAYIIPSAIDTADNLTTAQVQEMYNYGWDICSHEVTDFTSLANQTTVENTISAVKSYIQGAGWSRYNSELHLAYPGGAYNSTVLDAMTAQNMLTGRTIINRTQANVIDNSNLLCRQSVINTHTLAQAKAFVDRTISDGGAILLNFHKLEVTTADADTEILVADFEDLMDYIYARTPSIDVMTITEWYRGLTSPRRLI